MKCLLQTGRNGKKGLFLGGGPLLAFLLCLCFALFSCSPASAIFNSWMNFDSTFWGDRSGSGILPTSSASSKLDINKWYTTNFVAASSGSRYHDICFTPSGSWAWGSRTYFSGSFTVYYQVLNPGQEQVDSAPVAQRNSDGSYVVTSDIVTSTVTPNSSGTAFYAFHHQLTGYMEPGYSDRTMCFQGDVLDVTYRYSSGTTGAITFMVGSMRLGVSTDQEAVTQSYIDEIEGLLRTQNTTISAIQTTEQSIETKLSTLITQLNEDLDCGSWYLEDQDGNYISNPRGVFADNSAYAVHCQNNLHSFIWFNTNANLRIMEILENQGASQSQDRENAQDTVDDGQDTADSASDDFGDASESLLSVMGTTFGLIRDTPASDCLISITAGPDGVLQVQNIDLCSIPNEIKQLINRVFGIVMVVASLLLALNIFRAGMDLLAQALGYSYKEPEVTK